MKVLLTRLNKLLTTQFIPLTSVVFDLKTIK